VKNLYNHFKKKKKEKENFNHGIAILEMATLNEFSNLHNSTFTLIF